MSPLSIISDIKEEGSSPHSQKEALSRLCSLNLTLNELLFACFPKTRKASDGYRKLHLCCLDQRNQNQTSSIKH